MLDKLFAQLGFGDNEKSVYLCLAELGKATAQTVAKRTSIPRTTVYSVLDSLSLKGMVNQEPQGEVRTYVANPPSALLRSVEQEKRELADRESACKKLIELAEPLFQEKHFSVPRLQFFEGGNNVEHLLYEYTDAWHRSLKQHDNIWWGYQDPTILEHYTEWLYHHWKQSDPQMQIRLLSQDAGIERKLKNTPELRQIRSLPAGYDFSSTIWICGEYIVMIMSQQKPHYAFQIKDAVFASNLRMVFQLLWDSEFPKTAKRTTGKTLKQ